MLQWAEWEREWEKSEGDGDEPEGKWQKHEEEGARACGIAGET